MPAKPYTTLMTDIRALFEKGRMEAKKSGNHAQTRAYWDIGKKILASDLNDGKRAEYGEKLILNLAEDLTNKYGRGFSRRNLNSMVLLARTYKKTDLNPQLSWSQYVKLVAIRDAKLRRRLERQAIKEGLSFLALQRLVRLEKGLDADTERPSGKLDTYRITRRKMLSGKTERYLDLGFGVYANLPKNAPPADKIHAVFQVTETRPGKDPILTPGVPADLWLYRARVERIVDADTIIVLVQLLNAQHHRVRLRLAGIEVPEKGTDEEEKTGKYLLTRLQNAKTILIKTRGIDQYGRYVADVLYGSSRNKPEALLETGVHLNAELRQKQETMFRKRTQER